MTVAITIVTAATRYYVTAATNRRLSFKNKTKKQGSFRVRRPAQLTSVYIQNLDTDTQMVSVCMEHAARWTGADKIKPDKIRRLTSAPEISRDFHRDIGCLQQL